MKKQTPSEAKAQAIIDLLDGKAGPKSGPELLSDLVRLSTERVLQELLEQEQADFLGRDRYQRADDSNGNHGQRNGYEPRKLKTAEGVMVVDLPQVRGTESPYRSQVWSSLSNKSEVLEEIVREMWVRGLSVRDVEDAMLAATGAFVLSDTSVSKVTEQLYEQYEAFRDRDLSCFDVAYLFIDSVHEPLRRHGCNKACLCAWGICSDGSRVLLNISMGNSESYETCIDFLRDMVQRGLCTPLTVSTDGALGLIKAVDALWPNTWRIRCWVHKMRNLEAKVPPRSWPSFKALVSDVRDAPSYEKAKKRLLTLIKSNKSEFPEACRCLEDDMEASLNHLRVPQRHRQMVRTTNLVERTFVEERRRTKIIPHLWDEKSAVKLIFAVLIRVSDRWSRRQFNQIEQQQIKNLKRVLQLEEIEEKQNNSTRKRRSAGTVAA